MRDGMVSDEHRRKLARMAGQIAGFFEAWPQEQAAAAVAGHINQFWPGRMREDLLALAASGEALHPLVVKALARVKPAPH
jgi:formate dehydrogenase subunit delta